MSASAKLRRRIIWLLRHEWRWCEGGNSWNGFEALARDLGVDVHTARRETRKLARAGALYHSWMCNHDGCPAGSGYFLSVGWEQHVEGRADDPPDDECAMSDDARARQWLI